MAINLNELILKISSRISDTVDGDTVLLIEQNIPTSIYRVTKQLAATKAKGHEMLLTEQAIAVANSDLAEYGSGYKRFSVTDLTNKIVVDGNFNDMTITSTGSAPNVYKVHPVNSLAALSLSVPHGKACYFLDYPDVYISLPSGLTPAASTPVRVTHYTYLPLSSFPDQLEDFLVDDLVNLLQGEAQKQAAERSITGAQ